MMANDGNSKTILVPVIINSGTAKLLVSEPIRVPITPINIYKVTNTVEQITTHLCCNKIIFSAVLAKQILISCQSTGSLSCFNPKLPFHGFLDVKGTEPTDTLSVDQINISETSTSIANGTLQYETIIEMTFTVLRNQQLTVQIINEQLEC